MVVKCPACHEETPWKNNPYRPFCSARCKDQDLGDWATERYRIPVVEENVSSESGEEPAFRDKLKKE